MNIRRGDLIYVDLGQFPNTSIQSGRRPCIVISCNNCNIHSPTITVCPLSTKCNKKYRTTHVEVDVKDVAGYLSKKSVILAEQVRTIDKRWINSKIGHILETSDVLERLEHALRLHLNMNSFGNADKVLTKEEGNVRGV